MEQSPFPESDKLLREVLESEVSLPGSQVHITGH